ncbi:MAG: cation diffusion facilitator family transporter [Gammaproteobacteria bacterium]|nr:cation diffusion facilitator family transporter [Gammaproteobacteria bacterium]MBT8444822.1 cation diffusion facilitator family transporter [Gammaproteobacteria bacterium]NND36729.1 cation diffusion facilitator family transporter [Gammaproteobacteria bacterium]
MSKKFDKKAKERLLKIATGASVVVAAVLVIIKGLAWFKTGSVAMMGSLLDSILDAGAAGLNLYFVRRALRPADERHRFGHGKAEPIGGLFQAMIIGGSAVFLVAESIRRFIEPTMPTNSELGIVIMIVSSLIVGSLVLLQRYVARHTESLVVSGDALHGIGDVMINLGVIFALAVSTQFDAPYVDPIVGILLAGILFRGSWEISTNAMRQLMDVEFTPSEREKIRDIALAHPSVGDLHDLRTRRAGLTSFIQLHIELDGEMNLHQAHEIADEVELSIRREFPDSEVLIHQDPHGAETVTQFLRA